MEERARRGSGTTGKPGSAVILVIDEADAIAESRAVDQMHHEDRAGVNALIRGIDHLARKQLPVLVVLCTNRHDVLDPAVVRRATVHHVFKRPSTEHRESLLRAAFGDVMGQAEYRELARLNGPDENGRSYGFTCSDITQRLVPWTILTAFPDKPVSFEMAVAVLQQVEPTRPFGQGAGDQPL